MEVEDNGTGIPEDERARVLERFHRGRGARGEGCGLGLAIVQEIAALHDAGVEIRTPEGGVGTLIHVRFR
jgi:two-component system sensor histidine kinase TctE